MNRAVIILLSVGMVAVAVWGLLAGLVEIDLADPGVVYQLVRDEVTGRPLLWFPVVLVGRVIVAAVGVVYAVRQGTSLMGPLGPSEMTIGRGERGRTTVNLPAVARAAARDLDQLRGVASSRVRFLEAGSRPRVRIEMALADSLDLALQANQAEQVFQRVQRVLGADQLDVDIRFRRSSVRPPRVK